LADDPQTILAYEMNGQPLPVLHGAPLRLRVETQLGFTMGNTSAQSSSSRTTKVLAKAKAAGGKTTNISARKLGSESTTSEIEKRGIKDHT
jgi:hypothetical protein